MIHSFSSDSNIRLQRSKYYLPFRADSQYISSIRDTASMYLEGWKHRLLRTHYIHPWPRPRDLDWYEKGWKHIKNTNFPLQRPLAILLSIMTLYGWSDLRFHTTPCYCIQSSPGTGANSWICHASVHTRHPHEKVQPIIQTISTSKRPEYIGLLCWMLEPWYQTQNVELKGVFNLRDWEETYET